LEECVFEIKSTDAAYRCKGTYNEESGLIKFSWNENGNTKYDVSCDRETRRVISVREGDIKGTLTFEPEARTKAVMDTGYGVMEIPIETLYVNLPNMFNLSLEICYMLDGEKKIFSIRRLLQNDLN